MTGRGVARRLGLVAVLLTVTACSTVPSSSPTVEITQAPTQPVEEVGIEPVPPEPGATPEEIVRGFIDAAASVRPGHPVATEYLADEPAETWSDEGGITVLSPDYAAVPSSAGSVIVTANLVGTVDERGVFTVGGDRRFTREFALAQVDGEWRITDPPDGLIMLRPDFERLYDHLDAFFLDPTYARVVPDPRFLITGTAQLTSLVQRVLDGPSGPISAGVRNPLAGAQLRSAVSVEDQRAVVDLTALSTDPEPVLSQICAQLVWTLGQPELRLLSVEIRIDGEPVDLEGVPDEQTREDWASFDPDAVPLDGVGHFVSRGALRTVTAGDPVPGPAGTGAYQLSSAAVSADPRTRELAFLAGVRDGAGSDTLFAGPYGGNLSAVVSGRTLSAPTVAGTRSEAWVVRDGTTVVRVPSGAAPQTVNAPTLAGLGQADALQLSPDGVRAALVVDGPGGRTLYVATVVRAQNGAVELRDLRAVAPTLAQVVDVAWADSATLLVLAGNAAEDRIVPYSLGVDGWAVTAVPTAGLPGQAQSIGAAPTRQPLVDANGTIWQLAGGRWETPVRGASLPGTSPFYPL